MLDSREMMIGATTPGKSTMLRTGNIGTSEGISPSRSFPKSPSISAIIENADAFCSSIKVIYDLLIFDLRFICHLAILGCKITKKKRIDQKYNIKTTVKDVN
jgi:hypothetical protein